MQETLFESGCEIRYMFRRVFSPDKTVRQYSSNRYQAMLAQNKIMGSMSQAGYPYDNSPMESFFASLKKEYFYRREYATIIDEIDIKAAGRNNSLQSFFTIYPACPMGMAYIF